MSDGIEKTAREIIAFAEIGDSVDQTLKQMGLSRQHEQMVRAKIVELQSEDRETAEAETEARPTIQFDAPTPDRELSPTELKARRRSDEAGG